jgi:hypothetical protein
MQDIDRITSYPIEDSEWIANDCDHAYVRSLSDSRGRFRRAADAVDSVDEAALDGLRYRRAGSRRVILSDLVEISNGSPRIDELHSR